MLQHRPLEQRRIAEARAGEDHALGLRAPHRPNEMLPLLLQIGLVFRRGRFGLMQERARQIHERLAFRRDIGGEPASDQQ